MKNLRHYSLIVKCDRRCGKPAKGYAGAQAVNAAPR